MPSARSTRCGRKCSRLSSGWRRDHHRPAGSCPGTVPGHGGKRQVARMIIRKSAAEIELMAAAGAVVAGTLALLEERLEPGITMAELDRPAEEDIAAQGRV